MLEGKIFHKEETDSTQSDGRRLIEQGKAHHGDVCSASFQTAGRGRIAGRTWEAERDQSLMVTLLLKKEEIPLSPPLSLILGLGVALTMEKSFGLTPRIKWPNDIYLNKKKCSGILCESEKSFFLCGIGINLNQESFPVPLDLKATSLCQVTGNKITPTQFLTPLREELKELFTMDGVSILKAIEGRLLWMNETKSLLLGDPSKRDEIRGIIRGIYDDGALLFETKEGVKKIYSAEFL